MDQDRKDIIKRLEEIGRGDVTPFEASSTIRQALALECDLAPHVYSALSETTWRLLTSQSFNDGLVDWHETLRQAEALMEGNSPDYAAETRALSKLIAKSHRFLEAQPSNEVLGNKYLMMILSFVDQMKK